MTRFFPLFLVATLISASPAMADANPTVLVSTLSSVPNSPGKIFSALNHVDLNNAGQVAFLGGYSGGEAIFVGSTSNGLSAVLHDKDPVPNSVPPGTFSTFDATPYIDQQGHVSAVLSNSAFFGDGVWKGIGGTIEQMAINKQAVPGSGGTITMSGIKGFGGPWINDKGDVSFTSNLTPPSGSNASSGVFTYQNGTLKTVALNGAQAPGLTDGITMSGFGLSLPVMNDSGKIAFHAGLSGLSGDAIFTWENNTLTTDHYKGQSVAGYAGLVWNAFDNPDVSNNGDIAFQGNVQGPHSSAIWREHEGTLQLIAREGNAVPFIPGATYGGFLSIEPVINDLGNVAFYNTVTGPNITGSNDRILFSDGGPLGPHAVFRGGGIVNNGLWGDVHFDNGLANEFVLNGHGQVAFLSRLTGTSTSFSNDVALFAENGHGILEPVIREGDIVTLSPGIQRTVSQITFGSEGVAENTGNSDGRISGFNDFGDLAFRVTFKEGGQAIMVAHVVPELGSVWLIAIAGTSVALFMTAKRRGHMTAATAPANR